MNKLFLIIFFTYKVIAVYTDYFGKWFQDQTQEISENPIKIDLEFFNGYNKLPEILSTNSSLIRLGPTILNTPESKYTNYIDGFGRISKWSFISNSNSNQNEVYFQSTIIKSTLWNNSNEGTTIPPHITSEKIEPSKFKIVQLDNMDNTDVYPYRFETKPNEIILSTDFYQTNQIDYNNLKTIGSTKFNDNDKSIEGTFSSSHSAEYYDKINNKLYQVNWLGQKDLTGTKIKLYIMDDTYTRKIVGSYHINYLPYSIHSIMVINNYALLYISPVKLKFLATGFNSCISCSYTDNLNNEDSQFIIFDLTLSNPDSKPVSIINIPKSNNFFVFHYSNGKIISNSNNLDNLTKIEVDVCAYNNMEGVLGKYVLGNLEDILNPEIRDNIPYFCDNIKKIRLDIELNKLIDIIDLPLQDIDGNKYRVELPSINNKYIGKDYCYIYAVSAHILNSSRYEDMGIVKINLCKAEQIINGIIPENTATIDVFTLENVYFGEPIFVSNKPQNNNLSDEDDGYLLVVSRDGNDNKTKLLIIDAKTLILISSATAPFEVMFEFHGKYFID